jgi:phage terminase large subunit
MRKILLILFFHLSFSSSFAEILVFKNCTNKDFSFEKNEYKIDIKKRVMTREFIYSNETYERLRLNDARVKKENSNTKGISKVDGQIISEISGYPAFYTQMIFDTFDKTIKIKSVLNNTEGISVISKCEKIIKYKLES